MGHSSLGARLWQRGDETVPLAIQRALKSAPRDENSSADPCLSAMSHAVGLLDSTLQALTAIRAHLGEMAESAIAASAEPDEGLRALLAEDFEDLRTKLGTVIAEQPPQATDLLGTEAKSHRVPLKSGGEYYIAAFPLEAEQNGVQVPPLAGAFTSQTEVAATLASLDEAFARIDRTAETYKLDRKFLSERVQRLINS